MPEKNERKDEAEEIVLSAEEFRRGLADALRRVEYGGARITVTNHGRPAVRVVPVAA